MQWKSFARPGSLTCLILLIFTNSLSQATEMRKMKYKPGAQVNALKWQQNLRTQLFQLLQIDDLLSTKIPFNARVLTTGQKPGYTIQELELNSTLTRRIKVILTLPNHTKDNYPAVVCIHGHGGNRSAVYDSSSIYKGFAAVLAGSNYITIATNVGQHEIYENERILMGERLWDLMRCVAFLDSLPQVDKIGCAGLSLGGEMAMWLGAMDQKIAATLSSGFLTVMDQMEQNHCMCWKFAGLRELVDYADIYSLIAPRPLLCQNGKQEGPKDFYVPLAQQAMQEIQLIYRDFKKPEQVGLNVHNGGHEIYLPALVAFFQKYLVSNCRD